MSCCHYTDPFLYIHGIVQISKDTTPVFSLEVLHFILFFFFLQVDFEQLQENLCQMERRCKASWDHLKAIAKHEMKPTLKQKMSEFLKDCAERIIILKIVHRRIINRYRIRVMTAIS